MTGLAVLLRDLQRSLDEVDIERFLSVSRYSSHEPDIPLLG
jgi:hypothetical protein